LVGLRTANAPVAARRSRGPAARDGRLADAHRRAAARRGQPLRRRPGRLGPARVHGHAERHGVRLGRGLAEPPTYPMSFCMTMNSLTSLSVPVWLSGSAPPRGLPSFPTRRSSDLWWAFAPRTPLWLLAGAAALLLVTVAWQMLIGVPLPDGGNRYGVGPADSG